MAENIDDVLGLASQEAPELPDNEEMKQLGSAVEELSNLRDRISKGEELLKELKKDELRLSGETIPSLMDELGFSSLKTPDGREVSYSTFYSGKINPEHEHQAFDWIEENGHGGVIKGQMILDYRRPQRDKVLELRRALEESGWDINIKLGVHHSTLRALFRELVEEEGVQPPPDLFSLFIGRKTKIK